MGTWQFTKKLELQKKCICLCGNKKFRYSKSCRNCDHKRKILEEPRKVKNRPSKEELEILISKFPYSTLGKKYGVSDNCVKKWAKK